MAEQKERMDSFRLLLNEISHELTEKNLQSLVHIYGVPGSVHINDGLGFFSYLLKQDFISREKIGNLRNLIRKTRPRRRDLVRLVDNYIKKEFETNDVRSVLEDFSESWEQVARPIGNPVHDDTAVCKIDCAYLNCVCRRVPSCYTPLIVILVLAIIGTAVFWYANVPQVSDAINSNSDLKRAGVYILILEILALFVVIGVRIRRKLSSCLPCRKRDYAQLQNPTIQEGPGEMARSTSTDAIRRSAPRQYKNSGSESAVFSSYTTGGTGYSAEHGSMSAFGDRMNEQSERSEPEA